MCLLLLKPDKATYGHLYILLLKRDNIYTVYYKIDDFKPIKFFTETVTLNNNVEHFDNTKIKMKSLCKQQIQ